MSHSVLKIKEEDLTRGTDEKNSLAEAPGENNSTKSSMALNHLCF